MLVHKNLRTVTHKIICNGRFFIKPNILTCDNVPANKIALIAFLPELVPPSKEKLNQTIYYSRSFDSDESKQYFKSKNT